MIYVDSKTKQEIPAPDLSEGNVNFKQVDLVIQWVEESPAVYEDKVVKTYPNGGVELEQIEVKEATGHWDVFTADMKPFPYTFKVPEGVPHEAYVDEETIGYFTPYTEQEKAQMAEEKARAEKIQQAIDLLPETQADADAAICELYEGQVSQADTIAEQDAAICELYEMMIGA